MLTAILAIALSQGPVYPSPQSTVGIAPTVTLEAVATSDAYGFGSWLNARRAARGLRAVAYDPTLSQYAASSSSMGFGHHGPNSPYGRLPLGYPFVRRENLGMGPAASVWGAWTTSNGHWQALFDANITSYGIACVNSTWTYNAR